MYMGGGAGLVFKYERSSKGQPFILHHENEVYAGKYLNTNINTNSSSYFFDKQIELLLSLLQARVCYGVIRIEDTKLVCAISRKCI